MRTARQWCRLSIHLLHLTVVCRDCQQKFRLADVLAGCTWGLHVLVGLRLVDSAHPIETLICGFAALSEPSVDCTFET